MSHALLNASGAKQWLACPPSARATEGMQDSGSEFSREGTFGHELAEWKLRTMITPTPRSKKEAEYEKLKADKYYSKELDDSVDVYVGTVLEQFNACIAEHGANKAVLLLEARLDFSRYVREGFGTGDAVIITPTTVYVFDLKMGKGVQVDGAENPQMRLYGLGAIELIIAEKTKISEQADLLGEEVESWWTKLQPATVKTMIVQPRLSNFSGEEISTDDLCAWGRTVHTIAELAWAGKGEYKSGEHCRWCKIRATCRHRADTNLAFAEECKKTKPLDPAEIANVLSRSKELISWIKDVSTHALKEALAGAKFPGYKVVAERANREIANEEAAIKALRDAAIKDDLFLGLKGIMELEKALGKKGFEVLAPLVTKPEGKPTLVPESDKREELKNKPENVFDVITVDVIENLLED